MNAIVSTSMSQNPIATFKKCHLDQYFLNQIEQPPLVTDIDITQDDECKYIENEVAGEEESSRCDGRTQWVLPIS